MVPVCTRGVKVWRYGCVQRRGRVVEAVRGVPRLQLVVVRSRLQVLLQLGVVRRPVGPQQSRGYFGHNREVNLVPLRRRLLLRPHGGRRLRLATPRLVLVIWILLLVLWPELISFFDEGLLLLFAQTSVKEGIGYLKSRWLW